MRLSRPCAAGESSFSLSSLSFLADPTLRRKMAAYMESQEAEVLGKADKLEKGGFRAYLDGA